jgi:hypothetical protein
MIAAPATRCYIPALDFLLDRYTCIPMGNFIINSKGEPGGGGIEETFSSPGDVWRDALENSMRRLKDYEEARAPEITA